MNHRKRLQQSARGRIALKHRLQIGFGRLHDERIGLHEFIKDLKNLLRADRMTGELFGEMKVQRFAQRIVREDRRVEITRQRRFIGGGGGGFEPQPFPHGRRGADIGIVDHVRSSEKRRCQTDEAAWRRFQAVRTL